MSKFNLHDRCRIVRTGGDVLENATGVILGPTMESVGPDGFYIVLLDRPLDDRSAVVFTEHCLENLGPSGMLPLMGLSFSRER
jgi:hypothetical protein